MTNDEIYDIIANRGYPDLITQGMIDQAITDARNEMSILLSTNKYGSFMTVIDQNIYDVFSVNNISPPVELVDAAGMRAREVIWAPYGSSFDSNTDIFSFVPFLQYFNVYGDSSSGNFETPSDFTIFSDNLSLWRKKHVYGDFLPVTSEAGSAIQLMPMPRVVTKVWVFYNAKNTDPNIADKYPVSFLYFVEVFLNRILGKAFAIQMGLQMGAYKDLGKSTKYWQDSEKDARDLAMQSLATESGAGLIAPGSRS